MLPPLTWSIALHINVVFILLIVAQPRQFPREMPGGHGLGQHKEELLKLGYTSVDSINDLMVDPKGKNCNQTGCDWDPIVRLKEGLFSGDSSLLTQVVLEDGSLFVRKEDKPLSNTYKKGNHSRKPSRWNRKLSKLWGPFDPELPLDGNDRVKVDSAHYPFSAIGEFDNGCTGAIVGPCHVLTAGHCIFDPRNRQWSQGLGFTPGRTGIGGWAPNGRAEARGVNLMLSWQLFSNYSTDFGLVVLNSRIGDRTGILDIGAADPEESTPVNMAGYPDDKHEGEMWYDYCQAGRVQSNTGDVVYHGCTPDDGNSGSPLWVYRRWDGSREIQGIHTGVLGDVSVALTDSGGVSNGVQPFGVLLSDHKVEVIQRWISENQCY